MRLKNVLPSKALDNHPYSVQGNVVFFGQCRQCHAVCSFAPNLDDLCLCETGCMAVATTGAIVISRLWVLVAAFCNAIGNVVGVGTEKQMGRVTAWRIIAAMADKEARVKVSVSETVSDARAKCRSLHQGSGRMCHIPYYCERDARASTHPARPTCLHAPRSDWRPFHGCATSRISSVLGTQHTSSIVVV